MAMVRRDVGAAYLSALKRAPAGKQLRRRQQLRSLGENIEVMKSEIWAMI